MLSPLSLNFKKEEEGNIHGKAKGERKGIWLLVAAQFPNFNFFFLFK